jgi:hypothetical protein
MEDADAEDVEDVEERESRSRINFYIVSCMKSVLQIFALIFLFTRLQILTFFLSSYIFFSFIFFCLETYVNVLR